MNVLFFNHKIQNCGVYQYGKRLYDILKTDNQVNYIYKEIDCYAEYYKALIDYTNTPNCAIIYNYHASTMSWLTIRNIQKKYTNIGIPHESPIHLFDIVCDIDPTSQGLAIPRPIFENIEDQIAIPSPNTEIREFIQKYTDTNIPIFGSFGFGFENKGFHKIVNYVNDQYDEAIIKMVIPTAHFHPDPFSIHRLRELCINANTKPGVKLLISHDFFTTAELLQFLHSNTMNIFLYDKMYGRGISSTIDYALSVKKPFAISDSYMFRHIYSDEICLYKQSIQYCIENSLKYVSKYNEKYTHQNMHETFRKILDIRVDKRRAIHRYIK